METSLTIDLPKKKKNHLGLWICLSIFLFLGIIGYSTRTYIVSLYSLFQKTNIVIPRTQTEQHLTYTYTNQKIVNILLLGSDNDSKFISSNVLTQTVIIVSLNTQTNSVNIISIPRDYWVPIQGMSGGYGKIDQASGIGGFALTRQTVEKDFGIHIDYYAWVGLQGFVKVIDTFGGVTLDINHPVIDEAYPNDISGDDPYSAIRLYIPAGLQHLNGTQALEYVRSRHGDLQGDFGRSARQQQVLLTLKSKITASSLIPNIPSLAQALQGSVQTDMSVITMTQLAPYLLQIKGSNMHRYILSAPDYASNGVSSDGQDIVNPDFAKINALFQTLFN